MTGLAATSRGTETVAANIANVMTPGYARREMSLSAQSLGGQSGGVRIDGVNRIVNTALLSEARLSYAARSGSSDLAAFFNMVENAVGLPGETSAISTALTQFETALIDAASRPDEDLRLLKVVEAAESLTDRLQQASRTVQDARTAADISIDTQITALQSGLEKVAKLNKQIAGFSSSGQDISSLHDERQAVIDSISDIVPLRVVSRDAGRVSVFTAEGAVLLDGLTPAQLSFTPAGQFTADMTLGTAGVGGIVFNGDEISGSGLRLFEGGSLSAAFAIRDSHAPQIQAELDSLAYDIYHRFADPATDPSLAPGQPGLFTDAGTIAAPLPSLGFAARISINATVTPAGGDIWRLRAGINAAGPGPVGDASLLDGMSRALKAVHALPPGGHLSGRHDASGFFAKLESQIAGRRISAEADATLHETRAVSLSERLMADGVDTDSEMQRLLQYEQAYAANARVIQAIDEMMNTILRV
ncbi:flagellar hook-associated protein FlgK [Paracoccus tegillarcae]|uniref:flagellar hook-associated protein FlgK n=1 Tax=Paracoccus tegillarcae TaxID=1529068 RepID=UPI0013005977|nr:flagellar hook-associated protein FlgK [Paracoccus tegillarcae]